MDLGRGGASMGGEGKGVMFIISSSGIDKGEKGLRGLWWSESPEETGLTASWGSVSSSIALCCAIGSDLSVLAVLKVDVFLKTAGLQICQPTWTHKTDECQTFFVNHRDVRPYSK